MIIRKICSVCILSLILCTDSSAEVSYGRLYVVSGETRSSELVLQEGETLEFLASYNDSYVYVKIPEYEHSERVWDPKAVIVGPCSVYIGSGWRMYKLTKPDDAMLSNVVTLPATSGDWNVQLEVSTDLTNWTAVAPGTFNGNPDLHFFRVRATQVQAP